jgi:hypothetical protein
MPLITTPDWILISRDGIHQLLQLTLELFLQVELKKEIFFFFINLFF